MISADHLRTFAVFAEEQNLSRAARRLHLSQPAVHAHVKALADDLGVALYARLGRGLVLTEAGVRLLAFARDGAEREEALRTELGGGDSRAAIVLAAGAGALVHLLAPGIRAFTRAKGHPRLEVVSADASQAVDLVRRADAHVGVGVLDAAPPELESSILVRASQVVVLPRSHRLARRRSVRIDDLADEPLVAPPAGGPQRGTLEAAFAARGIEPRVAAAVRGWDVVLRLVEVGIGLGIVNQTCAVPRSLVARPLTDLPPVTYRVFTRHDARAEAQTLVRDLATHHA